MQIHFISGLPRSGSTVLSAILRQNPRITAGMSTGLAELFRSVLELTNLSQYSDQVSIVTRQRLLKCLVEAYYYSEDPNRQIVFDTSRTWCNLIAPVCELFPTARIICCVRSPAWVLDSLEQFVQRNPFIVPNIFGNTAWHNVYLRASVVMPPTGLVGSSLQAFCQAYFGPYRDRLIVIPYESLVRRSSDIFGRLYDMLQLEPFPHDLENFEYDAPIFDARIGMLGLHRVRGPLKERPRDSILPQDLFEQFDNTFWNDPRLARSDVTIL